MTSYVAEYAWLGGDDVAAEVVIDVAQGHIRRIEPGGPTSTDVIRLPGLVLPGLADGHSHAFHRALRGRTQSQRGTFWSWRQSMYGLADRLDPDTYHALARALFAEAALAGFTAIGEFHYLHHQAGGTPYADPNEMGHALVGAAREAGVRLSLLDVCYLAGGIDQPPQGAQLRFSDGTVDAWTQRVEALHNSWAGAVDVRVGAAIHSIRAVPTPALPTVAGWARTHDTPLHVHLSEQPDENRECLERHGATPTALLHNAGALRPGTTAVHATHLTDHDIALLGDTRTTICMCPTTERELADGIGPADRLRAAGAPLSLGSDSHAVVDGFEEARATELDLRLATLERGHLDAATLATALTSNGQASLGFDDAGRLEVGARADLVAVRLDSVRTAGASRTTVLDTVLFAATAADVTDVVVDGEVVVHAGAHRLGHVGQLLDTAIRVLDDQG